MHIKTRRKFVENWSIHKIWKVQWNKHTFYYKHRNGLFTQHNIFTWQTPSERAKTPNTKKNWIISQPNDHRHRPSAPPLPPDVQTRKQLLKSCCDAELLLKCYVFRIVSIRWVLLRPNKTRTRYYYMLYCTHTNTHSHTTIGKFKFLRCACSFFFATKMRPKYASARSLSRAIERSRLGALRRVWKSIHERCCT